MYGRLGSRGSRLLGFREVGCMVQGFWALGLRCAVFGFGLPMAATTSCVYGSGLQSGLQDFGDS